MMEGEPAVRAYGDGHFSEVRTNARSGQREVRLKRRAVALRSTVLHSMILAFPMITVRTRHGNLPRATRAG